MKIQKTFMALVIVGLLSACSPGASNTPSEPVATTSTDESNIAVGEPNPATPTDDATADVPVDDSYAAVLATLNAIPVKGRAPKTGYKRENFGPAWSDVDHNGCDTRNDILARDLTDETFKAGTKDCVVLTGTLADPYSGTTINFVRGQDTSSAVQIDHMIPLSLAWQTGAQEISAEQRLAFANDPLNLLAADGPLNMQKSDGDAATWLPPNKAFRCEYISIQVSVRAKYSLWVTQPEKDAMVNILSSCSGKSTSVESADPVAPPETSTPAPAEAPAPVVEEATPVAPATGSEDAKYGSCKDAQAAGFGPYVKGTDAEYDWYKDGDSDGTVCEN